MALIVDPLYVACTRPEMKWGVPWDAFKVNFFGSAFFAGFIVGSPPGLLIGVLIHFGMRELSRTNPQFFHKWKLYLRTKAKSLTKRVWGGSRLQPAPDSVRSYTDMRISV